MRRAAAAGTALLALLLSGCAAPSPLIDPPPGVAATVSQSRLDLSSGRLVVAVTSDGAADLLIERAELRSGYWLEPLEQSPRGAITVRAGRTVDVRVAPGELDCAADARPEHVARITTAQGVFELEAPDIYEHLDALHEQGCFAERVGDLRLEALSEDGDLVLAVPEGVIVEAVRATTLLTPTGPPVERGGGLMVPVQPSRCDAHSLAEDKAGTRIPVDVRLADGTTGQLTVVADDTLRVRILTWTREACALR